MLIKRRAVLSGLGAATAFPGLSYAQEGPQKLVAVFFGLPEHDGRIPGSIAAIAEGLSLHGWTAGQNLSFEFRYWDGTGLEMIRREAEDLTRLGPDIYIVAGPFISRLTLDYAGTKPVVFFAVSDPIAAGLVVTLARPGGNVTGMSNMEPSLGGKWLDLLTQAAPDLTSAVFMFDPRSGQTFYEESFRAAATDLGIVANTVPATGIDEIMAAMAAIGATPNSGLVTSPDAILLTHRREIVGEAARLRIPAVYSYRDYVAEGGLMSYGINSEDMQRRAGAYAGRILNGELAAELPVEFPTTFTLSINMKTAAEQGIRIPASLQALPDEIIE